MKFGLSIPTLTGFPRETEPTDGGWRTRWARSYEIVDLAEKYGFYLGTVGHHRFTQIRIDSPQPMIALAALAGRTNKLSLCTNICIPALHNPVDIAEQVAMVDEISDGRVIFGVAIGYRPYEFEQINLNYKERVSRFEESLAIIRQCWSPQSVLFEGKHFTVRGADVHPKPVQRRGPPIWIGAQVDAAISRAARLSDGWLTDNMESATDLAPKIRRFRAESRSAGNAGTVVLNRKVGIGADRRKVEEEWLPPILDVYREYLRLGVPFDDALKKTLARTDRVSLTDIPDDKIIAGTPSDCIASLRKCIEVTDCDCIIVDFGRAAHGEEYFKIRDQIELFGREVMPALA
jgi:probable F420-dependent oxidoreductase